MKKLILFILLCATMSCIMPTQARATHAAGAELLFQWVHDSTYQLFYKFYRDCGGVQTPLPGVKACWFNSCNSQSGQATLDTLSGLIPPGVPNGTEVSRLCPGPLFHTTCTQPSSTLHGYREWWYTGYCTLPSRCNHWTFNVGINARNSSIANIVNPGGQVLYTEATLDNDAAQGDTSPFFSVKPVPYICAGIPYVYNNGAYDINNDSLDFELMMPQTSNGYDPNCAGTPSSVSFATATPAFNLTNNPMQTNNTFTLNHSNGLMSFTPDNTPQYSVVTIRVDEYRNGQKIGSVMRDIQIITLTCNIQQPAVQVNTASLNNCTVNNGTVTACAGTPFSFCYNATAVDSTYILVVSDNSATIMSTSTVTYSNQAHDTVTGCFSWWPTAYDTGLKIFTVTVDDSNCAPPGLLFSQTFTIPIYVWPATTILNDTGICIGGTATLLAVGGGNFTWTVVPGGDPLSTLSCTSCNNPSANPTTTTQYIVTSGITNAICKNKDTVTVRVADSVKISIPDTTTCVNNSLQLHLNVVTSPTNNYSISWSPSTGLSGTATADPIVTPPSGSGTITYVITVTSGVAACNAYDTFHLRVLQGFKLGNQDTTICLGKNVQVFASGDPNYFYSWTPSANISNPTLLIPTIAPSAVGTQTYTLTGSFPGCNDSTNSFRITVEPVPTVVAGVDRQICSGDTVHLSPTITPAFNGYTFNWSPGAGLNDPTLFNPTYYGTKTAHLTITAQTSVAHCSSSDSMTIVVIKKSFLKFSPADTAICPHDTIQINVFADATVDQIQSFYWGPNTFISDINNPSPIVWPVSSSAYTVYARDTAGCLDTASMYITIKPGAVIDIPDSITIFPGDSYHITPGSNCTYFKWFPAIGLSADSVSNPVATPTVNTRYTVQARTESGCMIEDTINIYIAPDSYINLPNVFTPGNGPNGTLKVLHLGSATLKSFQIFNRWGVKVFESNDINKGWDGEFNGQPQPAGVYVYTVEAYTYKGKKLVKNGNVTLLR